MSSIIVLKNVVKNFKSERVIDNVSIEFERGKTYGIIGRNGSGKTVLLKLICGLLYPQQGSICVNNKVIGQDVDFPDDIGIIIEAPGFLPYQSGYNNLRYLASFRNKITNDEIKTIMRKVGLDPSINKHVSKYSLGMKQRLGIAQALMENPSILILDEPMNALDSVGVEEIRKILLDQKEKGKTILLASHIKDDVEILCDHVCEFNKGRIQWA